MGISQIEEISRNLQKNHISPDEKVSIIKNASLKKSKNLYNKFKRLYFIYKKIKSLLLLY